MNVHYQKRKNTELFKEFEQLDTLFLSKPQNYVPIYKRFFNLNETNYNNINLNNKWYITNIKGNTNQECKHIFKCKIKQLDTNKSKDKNVFFKLAPLLDPYKYMIGKYDVDNPELFRLPALKSTQMDCNPKLIDYNNAAYVDSMFLFLSSQLKSTYNFKNGVDYYGSFLAIKNQFKMNVFDDIDYLNNSAFFNKHKNVLFQIDNYEHLFQQSSSKLKPIKIGNDISLKSIKSVNNDIFEDLFEEEPSDNAVTMVDLNGLKDMSIDVMEFVNDKAVTLRSNSSCSSRSSHTNDDDECYNCDHQTETDTEESGCDDDDANDDEEDEDDSENHWTDVDSEFEDDYEEEKIEVTIPTFPVQVIAMEHCEQTFDDLILTKDLTTDEWLSAFMQIIMILITYQKAFQFTHNDLHTNNVMYIETETKYLYYCYKKKTYKVPTFGRIFKIIDFGRSIFKFDGKVFCSDSFNVGGDASTQYNTEPYFNDTKPRLEPNPSFDLCRLACSIFDYIIEDFDEMKNLKNVNDPIKKLVFEWCLDDKGLNMLYKNNGVERYPEFKLYKMIARCVHKHTPQSQLERVEFAQYEVASSNVEHLMDIDKITSCC